MDAAAFWKVIGEYNSQTLPMQALLGLFLAAGLILSYLGKVRWSAKLALGLANLWIGLLFFGAYGTEPIQKFFAMPLYLGCGALFLYECVRHKEDRLEKPSRVQACLLLLFLLYPAVSLLLGNRFPAMVTYVMPCPVVSLSLAVYSGYGKRNRLLMALLTIWGLTGIKSLLFHAYEDLILLLCGIYGVCLLWKDFRGKAKE